MNIESSRQTFIRQTNERRIRKNQLYQRQFRDDANYSWSWLSMQIGDNDSMHHGGDIGIGSHYHCLRIRAGHHSIAGEEEISDWHLLQYTGYWKVNNGMHVHVPLRFHITFTFALVSFKRVTLHNYNCLEPPDWRFYGYNLVDGGGFFLICQQNSCKDTYLDPI